MQKSGKRKRKENAGEKEKKIRLESDVAEKKVIIDNKVTIVDRLNAKDPRPALQELTEVNEDTDVVDEFFSCGGQVNSLLKVLELRDHKVKANDVALVFSACQTILMRVVRSDDTSLVFGGRGYSFCQELTKRILEDYDKEITILLSGQNTSQQAKSVLRLLTAMVTLGPSTAKMVLVKLDWDNTNWESLPKRISRKESPDVRTCYIHFLLSFLMEPNQVTLKEYFERRTRLTSIFAGLMQDPAQTVHLVLQTFRAKILENPGVSKTYKMRLFGSNNLKPLLALFSWTGPKKTKEAKEDDESDTEEHIEELEEVKSSLMEFLKGLLTSHKFGVVFQDSEYGCERSANPLIAEVVGQLTKPWESEDIASLTSLILSQSPAEIYSFLDKLRSEWKPRSSSIWLKIVHLLYVVFNNINIKHIKEFYKKTNKIGIHILKTIILPLNLLNEVLVPGISVQSEDPGLAQEDETVSRNSLELMAVIIRNVEQFVQGANKPVLEKEIRFLLKDRFPGAETLMRVWRRELSSPTRTYIPHILSAITFHTRYCGGSDSCVDIVQVLKDLETLQFGTLNNQSSENSAEIQSSESGPDPRMQTLRIITDILGSENQHGNFLARFLTEDTFCMLLNCLRSKSDSEREEARNILETIGAQTKICLPDSTDLKLLLALKPSADLVPEIGKILMRSVNNIEDLEEEILGYEPCSLSQEEVEKIMDNLMDGHTEERSEWPTKCEVVLSPLILSMLEADIKSGFKAFLHNYLESLALVLKDGTSLLLAVNMKCHIFSPSFIGKLDSLVNPPKETSQKSVEFLTEENAATALILSQVYTAHLVRRCQCDNKSLPSLKNFLDKFPDIECKVLVEKMPLGELFIDFNPFIAQNCDLNILIMSYMKKFGINENSIVDRVIELTQECIKSDKDEDFNKTKIRETFENLQTSSSQLIQLLDSITQIGVNRFIYSGKLSRSGHILAAVLFSLGCLPVPSQDLNRGLIHRLSSHVEFILQQTSEDDLGQSFVAFLSKHTGAADQLSNNLFYVCAADLEKDVHRDIASLMVKHSARLSDVFGEWMVKSRSTLETRGVLKLLHTLIQQGSAKSLSTDKKLLKVILKQVLASVTDCLTNLDDSDLINAFDTATLIFESLMHDITSSKTVALIQNFYSEQKSALKYLRSDGSKSNAAKRLLIQLNYALYTVLQVSGTYSKKDLLNYVLVPTIEVIVEVLTSSLDFQIVKVLCDIGSKTLEHQTSSAVKTYLKKNKAVWSAFIKGVLKHGLRSEDIGDPALLFLSSLCSFRYSGVGEEENQDTEDEEEMKLVVEMLTSHSGYLPLIVGEHTMLKTRILNLLCNLAPASCRQEQIKPLLSGYGATLSPSDRWTLKLLCIMERNGVNVCMQRPLVFGKQAVKQAANPSSKANKVSDCLSALNPDLVQRTISNFPVNLYLDPTEDVVSLKEESLYDPRFLLPYLSSLTGSDAYIDRHMKLVESGAVSLALVSLSSQDTELRGMGYHILHRFFVRMNEAKMMLEKQIWIHVINLIKHGLAAASESKVCLKLPSVTTLFLARSMYILCNPTHHMYNSISTFLLAKPTMNLFTVPEFLRLFHSKDVNAASQRLWILNVLRDGLRDRLDHQMFVQQYVYKLLLSNFGSCLADRNSSLTILEILERGSRISVAAFDLVANHGVPQWLALISPTVSDKKMAFLVLRILSNLAAAVSSVDSAMKQEDDKPKTTFRDILRGSFGIVEREFEGKFADGESVEALRLAKLTVIET